MFFLKSTFLESEINFTIFFKKIEKGLMQFNQSYKLYVFSYILYIFCFTFLENKYQFFLHLNDAKN